jgi:hypothetical protein
MSSFSKMRGFIATAALVATLGVIAMPAHAAPVANSLSFNSLTTNALAAGGSAIGDLNGVAVEAVRRDRIDRVAGPRDAPSGLSSGKDEEEEIDFDQLSQIDPGGHQ